MERQIPGRGQRRLFRCALIQRDGASVECWLCRGKSRHRASGDNIKFGQGYPEKVIDYAYRAVHVMTENAALIIHARTGRFASRSYFVGCSAGGHQALSEAQRYPADYDGIIAGAPANNRTHQTFGFLWSWRALHRDDGTPILTLPKLALVSQAVSESCGASDGLKDRLIEDPRRCQEPDLSKILAPEEIAAVRKSRPA